MLLLFLTFFLSSHVLLLLGYPSHLTRYCFLFFLLQPPILLSRIYFTLYSSWPLTFIGSGRLIFGSLEKGSRRLM